MLQKSAGPMKKLIGATALAFLVTGGGGAYWWSINKSIESTDNAYVAGDITAISSELGGRIANIVVRDNEAIHAGDVLVILEDSQYLSRVAQAEAAVAGADAAKTTIEKQIAYQDSKIEETMALVAGSQAELDRSRAAHERKKKLVNSKIIAVQELEEATADFLKADSDLDRTTASLRADRAQLEVLIASRSEAIASKTSALETLVMARIELGKTVIRSPIAGVVGDRAARVGQYVRPGTHVLSVVPNEVYVLANFKETQFQNMRPGQPVHMTADAFPNVDLVGRIDSFSPASGSEFTLLPPENATGNFTKVVRRLPVRIQITDSGPLVGLLRPGLSVEASVDTAANGNTRSMAASEGWLFGAAFASESK